MEAVRTSDEASTPQSTISYIERVKSRLARIPTTPSSIIAPSPSLSPVSELAESFSTIATATSTTEALADSYTPATSVSSLPQIFTIQKYYVSPAMAIDEKIQNIWAREIKPRLSAILLHDIPAGTCVQEFMMAGKRIEALKPTLTITCGDSVTRKRVEKTFKSQRWLQELLKTNGITFIALVAKTPLSAGPAKHLLGSLIIDRDTAACPLPFEARTSCGHGLIANIDTQQYCTLGGLLMVNGEILGLTARHPFESHEADQGSGQPEPLDMARDTNHISDDNISETSNELFVFNGDDSDTCSASSVSSVSLPEDVVPDSTSSNRTSYAQTRNELTLSYADRYFPIMRLPAPMGTSSYHEYRESYDWVLLEALPLPIITRPNKIAHIDPRHDVLVEEVVTGPAFGDVTIIIASIGPQLGCLHSSPATMKVEKTVLNVQLITLERALRKFC